MIPDDYDNEDVMLQAALQLSMAPNALHGDMDMDGETDDEEQRLAMLMSRQPIAQGR